METLNKKERNAFTALCEYASKYNWCWKIYCSTCAHSGFRVAFSKLIRGQHPDSEEFWPKAKYDSLLYEERDRYCEFMSGRTDSISQIELANIVSKSSISDIQSVATFPNWLGYIGLVLFHCPDSNATKTISDSFIPQFISILESNKIDCEWLKESDKILTTQDLGIIESHFYKKQF